MKETVLQTRFVVGAGVVDMGHCEKGPYASATWVWEPFCTDLTSFGSLPPAVYTSEWPVMCS